MFTGEALLQSIIENPQDDMLRLVYADWLEETDDPINYARAELIRIQIELETGIFELPRLAELRRRETELLDHYRQTWAGPLAVDGLYWYYRKGFLHRFAHRGLFRSKQGNMCEYLRFYPDGRVITLSSTREADQVVRRFSREWPDISYGQYELYPGRGVLGLHFSSTDSHGTVDYRGTLEGHTITMDTQSRINGFRGRRRYTWVDIENYDSSNDNSKAVSWEENEE